MITKLGVKIEKYKSVEIGLKKFNSAYENFLQSIKKSLNDRFSRTTCSGEKKVFIKTKTLILKNMTL